MDRETRGAIERATQRARELLEEDFGAQLAGDFDVLASGAIAPKGGAHLSPRQEFVIHQQLDWFVGGTVQFNNGAMTQLEDVLQEHLPFPKPHRDGNLDVQDQIKIDIRFDCVFCHGFMLL